MRTFDAVQTETWAPPRLEVRMHARILGALQISRGTEVLSAGQLGGPKARQILEILLLHLGTPVSKSTLVDLLWAGAAPAAAVSTLESHVSVLRRCLQPGQGKAGALKTTTGGYLLDQESIDLDLACFASLLQLAQHSNAKLAHHYLAQALAMATEPLLGSELLPEWAETERRMHEARVASARILAAQSALELGLGTEAVRQAQCVLDTDALNEPAWTALILGLELDGNPVQGLRAFDRCRRIMDRELGCLPGPVLQAAQQRMLQQASAANDDFGQVIQALLTIRETRAGKEHLTWPKDMDPSNGQGSSLHEAGDIILRYLQGALSGMAV